ncbi:S-adenosyl-L-methionine-dependent methyltransferase [Thamnidium elegans]|nr:S-adenosyl-L-methionine-dependent methyltransferase [Thamnidium elegans]
MFWNKLFLSLSFFFKKNMPKKLKLAKIISREDKKCIGGNELREGYIVNRSAQTIESIFTAREEDEQLRWTGSHFAAKYLFKSNLQPEVENYLSFEKGVDCLHIGCGGGAFLMDMASEYPKSRFVGVDTVQMTDILSTFPNISFSLGSVTEGLNLPDNSFDYIEMREFGNLLKIEQWPIVLKEVHRLLKPGGCAGFFEYELRETGNDDCARVFMAMKTLMERQNQDPLAAQNLKKRAIDAGLEHIVFSETSVNCGPDTGTAKTWRWCWKELCLYVGPFLSKVLKIDMKDWPDFVDDHIEDMTSYHGHITIIRSLIRKPLK